MKIFFYIPAILFLISGLPQMFKLLKTKSSKDISIWMYVLTLVAIGIIIVDSFLAKNYSILVSNATSFIITAVNTFFIIRYRNKRYANKS